MSAQQPTLFSLDELTPGRQPARPGLLATDTLEAAQAPFDEYMGQREFAQNTRASFRNDMKLFLGYVGPQTPLAECSQSRLEAFLEHLQTGREAPCSPRSLDRRITTLKVFFGWLTAKGVLPADPAAPLEHTGSRSPLPQVLTDAQVEQVLTVTRQMRDAANSPDARPHLLVTLILDSAIKKTECVNLSLADVDVSDASHPSITIQYDRPRQRFKVRRLGLSADWARTLDLYLRRYQPTDRLFDCTGRNLEYVLHTLATVAGLRFALTFEMLRWTSAVRSLRAGMEPDRLRRRLGLSRIAWQDTWPTLQKLAEDPL